MRTLFLQAPSFDGFDGGAGSRYQARREIRSYWYPTWLAQVAALVPDSKLIDAAPHRLSLEDVNPEAQRAALGELGMKDLDDLYEKIGLGERLSPLVARRLLPGGSTQDGTGASVPLAIAGTEGLLVTYARCCFPIRIWFWEIS